MIDTICGSWSGTRFDGRSGAGEIVTVAIEGDVLRVVSRTAVDMVPLKEARIPETFRHAPAMIGLPGGVTLELRDPAGTLGPALEAAGHRVSPVVRMQRRWPAALASLVALLGVLTWAYVAGVPLAASALVEAMPPHLERQMGERVLEAMDMRLRASELPAARRAAIEHRFVAAAATSAPGVGVRVEFRAGPPNAFALPGGIVVLFDGLVNLAQDDDEVMGVLGHELGHVVHRHSTRQLVQAIGVAAAASLLWGDFSSVAANAPVLLGVFRYGREFEHEADEFAIAFMRAHGLPVGALDAMFARLEAKQSQGGSIPDFLSTHPSTEERRQRLRQAATRDARPDAAAPADPSPTR